MCITKISPTELKTNLTYYGGSEQFYKHKAGFTYSDGIKYLAESAKCFWLLDLVGSLNSHEDKFVEKEWFIKICLAVRNGTTGAVFIASDRNDYIFYTKEIRFTDFPLSEITLFFCNGTLMLPSEYN